MWDVTTVKAKKGKTIHEGRKKKKNRRRSLDRRVKRGGRKNGKIELTNEKC
jgi:hypothetical protein